MSAYKSSNPFEDDQDDDFGFEKVASTRNDNVFEDKQIQISRQIDESESRQLDSTRRAMASIYESESMGTATAEELLRQGDTLKNIEQKTDAINKTMTVSQKHLNNIKSVFGGIKNWWGGNKKEGELVNERPSKLRETLEAEPSSEYAAKKVANTRGFYEEDDDLDSQFLANAPKSRPAGQQSQTQVIQRITHSAQEDELDSNLGLMCEGMSRLKGLALGLGDEIERQNDDLDRINQKTTKADSTLEIQNRQMRKILK